MQVFFVQISRESQILSIICPIMRFGLVVVLHIKFHRQKNAVFLLKIYYQAAALLKAGRTCWRRFPELSTLNAFHAQSLVPHIRVFGVSSSYFFKVRLTKYVQIAAFPQHIFKISIVLLPSLSRYTLN